MDTYRALGIALVVGFAISLGYAAGKGMMAPGPAIVSLIFLFAIAWCLMQTGEGAASPRVAWTFEDEPSEERLPFGFHPNH